MSSPAKHLTAKVDPDVCAGVAQCIQVAPKAFHLDRIGQSVFDPDGSWTDEEVQEAADSCPMAAIGIVATGK